MEDVTEKYKHDIDLLSEIRDTVNATKARSRVDIFLKAAPRTETYKLFLSILSRLSSKLDELDIDIDLQNNGLFSLDGALRSTAAVLSPILYKGAVTDYYHNLIPFLDKKISYYKSSIIVEERMMIQKTNKLKMEAVSLGLTDVLSNPKEVDEFVLEAFKQTDDKSKNIECSSEIAVTEDEWNVIGLGKQKEYEARTASTQFDPSEYIGANDLNLDGINLGYKINDRIYSVEVFQKEFIENMNKITEIITSGELTYGTNGFYAVLRIISNIYEGLKYMKLSPTILHPTEREMIRRVRVSACHDLYKNSDCMVEVIGAIGVLIAMACKVKNYQQKF